MNSLLQPLELTLAAPRGFCAGVERAILIVEEALRKFGAPIYVRHEVVHNRFVVDGLRRQGAIFVEELEEVPDGARVIFSAHGVAKSVQEEARRRGLDVLDATCPLVTKVHIEVARMRAAGFEVVMIGHRGHPEVAGTMGQSSQGMYLVESCQDVAQLTVLQPKKLAYVTQTTLSIDDAAEIVAALKDKFPGITAPKKEDICYATQNRQSAVKALVAECDLVLVVGARNSSNSNRLREVAENHGRTAYLVEEASELNPKWLAGKSRVVVTAGASTPEEIVQDLVTRIHALVGNKVTVKQHQAPRETVIFPLPKELAST